MILVLLKYDPSTLIHSILQQKKIIVNHFHLTEMWSPTHVQVLVKKAKGLITKGKNGTNDAFVTIALGKEKYQTSVKEKTSGPTDWSEQCEL